MLYVWLIAAGINALGTTARYGWGAENVLKMQVIMTKRSVIFGWKYQILQSGRWCLLTAEWLKWRPMVPSFRIRMEQGMDNVHWTSHFWLTLHYQFFSGVLVCIIAVKHVHIFQPDVYRSQYKYTDDTDLWFALRGAGSSYGIPTCFFFSWRGKVANAKSFEGSWLGFNRKLQILSSSKLTKI